MTTGSREVALTKPRDRKAEARRAKETLAGRVSEIAAARHDGSLGDEVIKLAQVIVLCSLPHSNTGERQLTRRARLGDGTTLEVTFNAMLPDVPLPYGKDRKLLAWIFDRAIRSETAFIPWRTATEYLKEMGMSDGGNVMRQLAGRFERIAGLGIAIRRGAGSNVTGYTIFAHTNVPESIRRKVLEGKQEMLPGMEMGVRLNADLFADIKAHNQVLPRLLWRTLDGPSQVQDIALWLCVRLYATRTASLIPWKAVEEQFGVGDSNPRRIRQHARAAVTALSVVWPEADVSVDDDGIRVGRPEAALLEDDPAKRRVRRLR